MSSRFTELNRKKRRNSKKYWSSNPIQEEHALVTNDDSKYLIKSNHNQSKPKDVKLLSESLNVTRKHKKCFKEQENPKVKLSDNNTASSSLKCETSHDSFNCLPKNKHKKLKKINKSTNRGQIENINQKYSETLQEKIQKKGECSGNQKRRQKMDDMASPSAKVLKRENNTFSNFQSEKPAHKASKDQNNHRKCSTKCKDDVTRGDNVPAELPGFYYDKEKKKYFKILPNNSCIGSAVTTATIKHREKEETRKLDLNNSGKPSVISITGSRSRQRHVLSMNCLPCLTNFYQQGKFSPRELDQTLNTIRIKSINKTPQTKIKINADSRRDWLERLEHASQLEMIENKHIVGLYTVKESMIQRILWLKMTDKPSTSQRDRLSLSIDPSPSCRYYQSAVKISSMCLIDKDSVLYTGMVYTGTPESLVFIKGLGESSSRYEVYSLGQKATWTCAWNKHANQFSVGSEKCGMLLDVQTRRLWQINSNNSDILCQVFSKQNGHCLYSGTRKNQIFTHDLRSISTYSVSQLTQSSSVCGLHLLQNDIHLLASDVKGKVNLWDLRTRKVVTEYAGMKNEYLRIPIHVDQSEEIVYGVDQEGYTRLWCLKTGELLKTIPPPMATSYDFFPSVLYSKTWNDRPGNAGLLMGLGDKVYVYSDYQDSS